MIHYQLRCGRDHSFDGWFRDGATFEQQAGAGLIACPECGDVTVNRALMAPAIGRRRKAQKVIDPTGRPDPAPAPDPAPVSPAASTPPHPALTEPGLGSKTGSVMPDQVRAMLQKLRVVVEKNSEHVGDRFAEEARAIHRGTSVARSIYGESTPEQAEALAEEGIEVARIPWVPRADS